MSLESPDRHCCEAALGFSELDLFQDADAELEKIDSFNRASPEVLRARAAIYHGTAKWENLRTVALKFTRLDPGNAQWPLSLCTHSTALRLAARSYFGASKPSIIL